MQSGPEPPGGGGLGGHRVRPWAFSAALLLVVAVALGRRLPGLTVLGLSSDEAVYVGQGRALAGDPSWSSVRAHPPLLGLLLDAVPGGTTGDLAPRVVSVLLGILAIIVAGLLGRELAGSAAGVVAAGVLAWMPYHADVTRLALVDVPMATCVALALLLVVRAARTGRSRLVEVAGACLGVATLFKETALLAAIAIGLALVAGDPAVGRRTALRSTGWGLAVVAGYPAWLVASGHGSSGPSYLAWQLGRTGGSAGFYVSEVLPRVGPVVVGLAVAGGAIVLRSRRPGATPVVLAALVPALFFALWPVTGYPYLLLATPPLAVLAAVAGCSFVRMVLRRGRLVGAAALAGALVAAGATAAAADPPMLPGASGVPGLRETADWSAGRPGLPVVVAAPWVANIVRYYRPDADVVVLTSGTPVPATRINPAYRGTTSAAVPDGAALVVWDAWSAAHDPVGASRMLAEVHARGGRVGHVELGEPRTGPRVLVVVFVLES